MAKERRKRTRIPAGFDISIVLKRKKIKVKTFNISLTGISCASDPVFRQSDRCEIILTLNPQTSLTIEGKILRLEEKEAIIAFLSMDEDTFFHLKRLIQYNADDPDKIEKELADPAFC
jgi:hypothetical protein